MKDERTPKTRVARVNENGEEIEVYYNELTCRYIDAADNKTSYAEDELDFIAPNLHN